MKKLTDQDAQTKSPDLVAQNLARFKALFPEAVTEDGVNVDVLKQLLGKAVTDSEEKYGLNWHGKRRARLLALTPSTGTLRPCPNDSVDWDTTQNLMIEGDNLEVLKLLQKSYAGKVKLIYIDPPYNTGKDFVYPDDFQDNIKNYLELTGQVDGEGRKLSSNTEASGRFHTAWLNMMYPRLKLARNLLREDGVIFISVDDRESLNLRQLCNDVFGEENFVSDICVVNNLKGRNDKRYIAQANERLLMYVRSEQFKESGLEIPEERIEEFGETDDVGRFRLLGLRKRGGADTRRQRPNMFFPFYADPTTGSLSVTKSRVHTVEIWPRKSDGSDGCWRWGPETAAMRLENLKAVPVGAEKRFDVFEKDYLEQDGALRRIKPKSVMSGTAYSTDAATKQFRELMPGAEFSNPKPVAFCKDLIEYATGTSESQCVLDFFAGSGTTGHAIMAQNADDGGDRRYILVQLPEPLDPQDKDQKTAADFCDKLKKPRNITELAKERLRRAGKKIRKENPLFKGDLGFRVFKLDSSNIRVWEPNRDDLAATLAEHAEHLKAERTEQDILFELLLKLGLDLTVPIEQKTIAKKAVHSVGAGSLLVCLAEKIDAKAVEPLALGMVAWHKELAPAGETAVVFRDSAFADDVAKTNLTAILQQNGLENVRSI